MDYNPGNIAKALSDGVDELTGEIRDVCITQEGADQVNITDGLFAVARSLEAIARSIHALGNSDAATHMGGLEALGKTLSESIERVAESMENQA